MDKVEMPPKTKLSQGTAAWFEMAGTQMCVAALQAGLPPDCNVSLVERYTDGVELRDGLFQGIRFDIINGEPSFKVGVRRDERAEITVEVTAEAARTLNSLRGTDYQAARDRFMGTGELRMHGDLSRLGGWLEAAHDPIVARTS